MKTPVKKTIVKEVTNRNRYIVTDNIKGNINGNKISAIRGECVYLNEPEYTIFKDRVLLIPKE